MMRALAMRGSNILITILELPQQLGAFRRALRLKLVKSGSPKMYTDLLSSLSPSFGGMAIRRVFSSHSKSRRTGVVQQPHRLGAGRGASCEFLRLPIDQPVEHRKRNCRIWNQLGHVLFCQFYFTAETPRRGEHKSPLPVVAAQ